MNKTNAIQSDKIVELTSAAGTPVEPIWANLLTKALEGKDIKELLTNVGAGGGPAAAAPAAAGGAAAAGGEAEEKKEEKKEEEKEESDEDVRISHAMWDHVLTQCRWALVSLTKRIVSFYSCWRFFAHAMVSQPHPMLLGLSRLGGTHNPVSLHSWPLLRSGEKYTPIPLSIVAHVGRLSPGRAGAPKYAFPKTRARGWVAKTVILIRLASAPDRPRLFCMGQNK